jgi:hypothetical protein
MNSDPLVAEIAGRASDDEATIALILVGSRGSGTPQEGDDYDFLRIVEDGSATHPPRWSPSDPRVSIVSLELAELQALAGEPGWWSYGLASGRVLIDKLLTVEELLARTGTLSEEDADGTVEAAYGAYLHALVRSLRSHVRGDVIGERLHAAASLTHLVTVLYALERRRAPFSDRLHADLATLDGQGWPSGYLAEAFREILTTGGPQAQREVQSRVEDLMEKRGVTLHRKWRTRIAEGDEPHDG